MTHNEAVIMQLELYPRKTLTVNGGDGTPYNPVISIEYTPTLCDICLNIRMSINGASDPWDDETLVKNRNMLEAREKTWADNKDLIDALIHTMVWHTVRMIDKELFSRNHNKAPIRKVN